MRPTIGRRGLLAMLLGSACWLGQPSAVSADSLTYEWSMLEHGRADAEGQAHTLVYGVSASARNAEWRLRLAVAASDAGGSSTADRSETRFVDVARGAAFRLGTRVLAVTAGLRYVQHDHAMVQRGRFAGPTAGLAFGAPLPGSRATLFVGLTADELFGARGRRYRAVAGEFGLTVAVRSSLAIRTGARVRHAAVRSDRERTVASARGDGFFLGVRVSW